MSEIFNKNFFLVFFFFCEAPSPQTLCGFWYTEIHRQKTDALNSQKIAGPANTPTFHLSRPLGAFGRANLGRFPFVRTDRPDQSVCKVNATI